MTERLLQFIWQFQYFNKGELRTYSGETIQIIRMGQYNSNQGPDFTGAKIKIAETTWVGNIELHIKTSDWKRHGHDRDKNYKNVILHVVWENDSSKNDIPVLELKSRITGMLLQRYEELMDAQGFIPCEKMILSVKPIVLESWKERLVAERLIRKSQAVTASLEQNNQHWEESFWWLLARNFGIKINADVFEEMARSLSIKILAKHKRQIHQLEALIFGQAGLLNKKFREDYPEMLRMEYKFLRQKYGLTAVHQPVHFLRMRPGNFPTVRLAQLAMLVNNSSHLFSRIKEAGSVQEIKQWFGITANDYWHYHYRFDEERKYKKKNLGDLMIDNIIINTVCPVLFAYGHFHNDNRYKAKAIRWLEDISAETNTITRGFQKIRLTNKSAYDSQANIELKNEYCNSKRCLDCAIGNAILKTG